jgi:hypothetical protein
MLTRPSYSLSQEVFDQLEPHRYPLVDAFADIGRAALMAAKGEVPRADAYFHFVSDQVMRELASILPPDWTCRVGGSFVHGGSKGRYVVTPSEGAPCEIGDLLIAVEYDLQIGSARSALLVQAKKAEARSTAPWTDGSSGRNQRELFANMPPFVWRDHQQQLPRPSCSRTLEPEIEVWCPCATDNWGLPPSAHRSRWPERAADGSLTLYGGAVFATLLDEPLVVPPLGGRVPRDLSEVLADLLVFAAGWEFKSLLAAYQPNNDGLVGWSAVVWDILRTSATRTHASKVVAGRRDDRTQVRLADEVMLSDAWPFPPDLTFPEDAGEPPDLDPESWQFPDDGGGISVVRVVVSDKLQ